MNRGVALLGVVLAGAGCARGVLSDAFAQTPPPPVASDAARADDAWLRVSDGVSFRAASALDESRAPLAWVVVRLDLDRVTPAAERAPGDSLAAVATDPRVAFVANAGFFNSDHRPTGLLIAAGAELAGFTPQGGSGTLVVRDHRAAIVASAAPLARAPRVALAVQCGPRLVERGGAPGVYRDDGARFARTAACIRDGGRTLDLIATWSPADPLRGPGLYAFSRMLAARSPVGDAAGCEAALNLDGGPSTGLRVRGASTGRHDALGPVPWVITVRD